MSDISIFKGKIIEFHFHDKFKRKFIEESTTTDLFIPVINFSLIPSFQTRVGVAYY